MININLETAIASLKKVVAAKGEDHVYQTHGSDLVCKYAVPSPTGEGYEPDCIVGHMLVDLGVDVELLQYTSGDDNGPLSQGVIETQAESAAELGIFEVDVNALGLLSSVQFRQDNGRTWGEALSLSLEELNI